MKQETILYPTVAAVCLVLAISWLKVNEPEQNSVHQSSSSDPVKLNRPQRTAHSMKEWKTLIKEGLAKGDSDAFSEKVANVSLRKLFDIASELRLSFDEDAEGTAEWLESVALTMAADQNHEQAAQLLNFLQLIKEIPDIERKLYHDWLKSGGQDALEMVGDNIEAKRSYEHQLAILASMYQNEHSEKLEDYLSWVEASEDGELSGAAIDKIVTHLEPENVDLVGEVLSRNIGKGMVQIALRDYVTKRSPDNRVETLDWITELPINAYGLKADLLSNVIRQVAREDVDKAAELLNSENFLTKYYPGSEESALTDEDEWSGSAQLFFDVTLKSFINGAIHTDLEFARNSAESFFNPELREHYGKTLDELLSAAQQNEEQSAR